MTQAQPAQSVQGSTLLIVSRGSGTPLTCGEYTTVSVLSSSMAPSNRQVGEDGAYRQQ